MFFASKHPLAKAFNALTRQGCGPYLSPGGVARSRRFQHEFTAVLLSILADRAAFWRGQIPPLGPVSGGGTLAIKETS